MMIAMPNSLLQPLHQVEDLRLGRHVERGRRLVGDQELGVVDQRHRDHHALAHAARELVRVVVDALLGARDPDLPSGSRSPGAAHPCLRDVLVDQHGLLELPADRLDRVQRGHRVLEDHRRSSSPRISRSRCRRRAEHLLAVEQHRARSTSACRGSTRPMTVRKVTLLPRAGLADDAERLRPSSSEKLTPVDRLDDAVVGAERGARGP